MNVIYKKKNRDVSFVSKKREPWERYANVADTEMMTSVRFLSSLYFLVEKKMAARLYRTDVRMSELAFSTLPDLGQGTQKL